MGDSNSRSIAGRQGRKDIETRTGTAEALEIWELYELCVLCDIIGKAARFIVEC